MNPPRLKRNGTLVICFKNCGFRRAVFRGRLTVAPVEDFNTEGVEIKNNKIQRSEAPDPIVLKPVIFKGKKHYLIVTAWGAEESTEITVNQQIN